MQISIKNLTPKAFAPYGEIIEPGKRKPQGQEKDWKFYVITREPGYSWRIGYYVPRIKALRKLEKHPSSLESFEPVSGISIIIAAEEDFPETPEAFLLNKPVILKKGIWHGILSLSDKVEIKITENLEVESKFYYLKKPLKVSVTG
ncbi:MAG: ureidoglycolate lyase [Firmicutes bacterium]|nr:ureidoglycolate lyase [Bacillota bacterium]